MKWVEILNGILWFMNMAATSLFRSTNVTFRGSQPTFIARMCGTCVSVVRSASCFSLLFPYLWSAHELLYSGIIRQIPIEWNVFLLSWPDWKCLILTSPWAIFNYSYCFSFCFCVFLFQCRDVHFINYNTAHWFNKPNQAPVISDKVCSKQKKNSSGLYIWV